MGIVLRLKIWEGTPRDFLSGGEDTEPANTRPPPLVVRTGGAETCVAVAVVPRGSGVSDYTREPLPPQGRAIASGATS